MVKEEHVTGPDVVYVSSSLVHCGRRIGKGFPLRADRSRLFGKILSSSLDGCVGWVLDWNTRNLGLLPRAWNEPILVLVFMLPILVSLCLENTGFI